MSISQLATIRQNLIAELAPLRDSDFEILDHSTKWVDVSLTDDKLYLRPRPYEKSISINRWSDLITIITNFVSKCIENLRRFFLQPYIPLQRKIDQLIQQTDEYLKNEKNSVIRAEFLNLYTPVYFKLLSAIKRIKNKTFSYPQIQKYSPFNQWIGTPDSRLVVKQHFLNGECPNNVQVAEFGLFRDFGRTVDPQSVGFKVSKWLSPDFKKSLTSYPYLLKLRLEGQKEEEAITKKIELGCKVADYTASIDDQLQPKLEIVPYRVVEHEFPEIQILPKTQQVVLSNYGPPDLSNRTDNYFLKITNNLKTRMYFQIAICFSEGRKECIDIRIMPSSKAKWSFDQLISSYSSELKRKASLSLNDNSCLFMNITRFTLSTD